jgi:hypothetical protein
MATVVQLKRSETTGVIPTANDIAVGELAVNLADGALYTKRTDGAIIEIGVSEQVPVFFADEVDLGDLTSAGETYDMGGLDGGSPSSVGLADVIDDETPQLGGDLDLNSNNITGTGNITFDGELTQGKTNYYTKQHVLYGTTTNATETEILIDGSTRIPVPTDTTIFYEVSIVARRTDATGESASWHLMGCADNFSNTVANVGNVYEVAVAQDDVAWAVDVRADNTNDAINVFVTGAASKTIRWTASIKTTEVSN